MMDTFFESIDKFLFSQNSRTIDDKIVSKSLFWIESKQLLIIYVISTVKRKNNCACYFDIHRFENSSFSMIHDFVEIRC